jgi:hypothetical protein
MGGQDALIVARNRPTLKAANGGFCGRTLAQFASASDLLESPRM